MHAILPLCAPVPEGVNRTSIVVEETVPLDGVRVIALVEKAFAPVLISKPPDGGVITKLPVKLVALMEKDDGEDELPTTTLPKAPLKLPVFKVINAPCITVNVELIPAVKLSPDVRVAVSVTPEPAEASVTALVIVADEEPAVMLPVIVPPITPAFPLVLNVKPVVVKTFCAAFPAFWA